MSKWLGFCVGFTVALTTLLTVVRPATSPRDATVPSARVAMNRPHSPFAPEQRAYQDSPRSAPAKNTTAEDAELAPGDVSPGQVSPPAPATMRVADLPADEELAQSPPGATELVPATRTGASLVPGTEDMSDMDHDIAANRDDNELPASAVTPPLASEVTLTRLPSANAKMPADDPADAAADTRQWYAFWQPFGSELSAQGFRRRLERLTGLDYRVVKIDAGEYHVAVGYDDEPGRIANLDAIEAATGLRLDGQSL